MAPTAIEQIVGFSAQHFHTLTPCMKLCQNGTIFLMIKLAASMAGPGLNSKQIERRTSNVEY
jgi:hypothetical protein